MKTTIEIPDELFKRAKIHAIETGQTLKSLLVAALERELGRPGVVAEPKARYWANRKLLPEFERLQKEGGFAGGTDSTKIISDERDEP